MTELKEMKMIIDLKEITHVGHEKKIPLASALIFNANFTAASKKSATLSKSSSTKPLDVRAGVPGVQR